MTPETDSLVCPPPTSPPRLEEPLPHGHCSLVAACFTIHNWIRVLCINQSSDCLLWQIFWLSFVIINFLSNDTVHWTKKLWTCRSSPHTALDGYSVSAFASFSHVVLLLGMVGSFLLAEQAPCVEVSNDDLCPTPLPPQGTRYKNLSSTKPLPNPYLYLGFLSVCRSHSACKLTALTLQRTFLGDA